MIQAKFKSQGGGELRDVGAQGQSFDLEAYCNVVDQELKGRRIASHADAKVHLAKMRSACQRAWELWVPMGLWQLHGLGLRPHPSSLLCQPRGFRFWGGVCKALPEIETAVSGGPHIGLGHGANLDSEVSQL